VKTLFLSLLALALALELMVLPASGQDNSAPVTLAPETSGQAVGADSAVVIEAMTGRVLYGWQENTPLPMASTTKIMTALLTLERPDLDAVFTVDSRAIKIEGSTMGLVEGDKVSLRALAAGMLLCSGNDAANAAAVRISGTVTSFVESMNARAKEMGLTNTAFVTPSGLDAEGHHSTALDMARLAREALKNDAFAEICAQYRMRVSFGSPPQDRWLTNHNKLLNRYEHAIGVKTGFTRKSGRCLVSAANRDGVTLICVTLDCPDDWTVHETLYERCFGLVQVEDLAKGAEALEVPVTGGTKALVKAAPEGPAQVPVPVTGGKIEYKSVVTPFAYAPVRKGQYLGETRILLDGELIYRLTLTAREDIPLLHEYKEEKSILDIISGFFK
jgi:D-alanyl-D-alanine carboxypeptidase/D-alanyl-D-alanine carboxypeptidase (penicillin-binding protein 5/6)